MVGEKAFSPRKQLIGVISGSDFGLWGCHPFVCACCLFTDFSWISLFSFFQKFIYEVCMLKVKGRNHMCPPIYMQRKSMKNMTSSIYLFGYWFVRSVCVSRLALYVYDYLMHVGASKAAQTFLSEVNYVVFDKFLLVPQKTLCSMKLIYFRRFDGRNRFTLGWPIRPDFCCHGGGRVFLFGWLLLFFCFVLNLQLLSTLRDCLKCLLGFVLCGTRATRCTTKRSVKWGKGVSRLRLRQLGQLHSAQWNAKCNCFMGHADFEIHTICFLLLFFIIWTKQESVKQSVSTNGTTRRHDAK